MNISLSSALTISVLAVLTMGAPAAEEARLAPLNRQDPALLGFLGTPGCGNHLKGGVVWHRSGRIIGLEPWEAGISPVSLWQPDAKTMQARRVALLNAGDAWCLSHKGDLLCAQSRRQDDQPELDPVRYAKAWDGGAFGCFRLEGGGRLWKLPMRDLELISGAAFTPDDKKVVVLSHLGPQMSLRLLDAASGLLLQQHDFPGRQNTFSFRAARLMMRGGELWTSFQEDGKQVLYRFSLATLQPTRVECPPLENLPGAILLSPDARRLACLTQFGVTCLELRQGKWEVLFEDHDFPVTGYDGDIGKVHAAEFTPDNQRLVIIAADFARVVDLASRKRVHQIKLETNSGAALSPDGSHLAVAHANGIRIVSLRDKDATGPDKQRQNVLQPHALRFLADGKTLLAADCAGIWVWDIPTRKPRAWLRSFAQHDPVERILRIPAVIAKETEVLAEEFDDILRWKLPSLDTPPPDVPQIVAPALAFGGVRLGRSGAYPAVFANPDASWVVHARGNLQAVIRSGLEQSAARSVQDTFPSVDADQWFFGTDDTLMLHDVMSNRWKRLDLQKATLEELPSPAGVPHASRGGRAVFPQPVGVLPRRQFVVREFSDNLCVTSLDGKTALPWFEMPAVGRFRLMQNMSAAVSTDEKRCGVLFLNALNQQHHVFVWDIETGRLLGDAMMPTSDVTSVALSPDGSLLACGHRNTAISLWEVARLTVPVAPAVSPSAPAPAKAATTPTPAPAAAKSPAAKPGRPRLRDLSLGNLMTSFDENGTLSQGETLPEAGRLRINGREFEPKQSRLTHPTMLARYLHAQEDFQAETLRRPADPKFYPLATRQHPEVAAGLMNLSEGTADGVWVARQTGKPVGQFSRFLMFTDTLTNLGDEPKQASVEFEVRFPALTQRLVDSTFAKVEADAEGFLKLSPDAEWIAALPAPGASRHVPVVSFRSQSGGLTARLQWKPETHSLIVHHAALLPPGDARYLAHGLQMVWLPDGTGPESFEAPAVVDFGSRVNFFMRPRGLNFGTPKEEDQMLVATRLRSAVSLPDDLGQSWHDNPDGSFHNDSGIAAAHQLWFDGAPLPGSTPGMFVYQHNRDFPDNPRSMHVSHGTSLDGKVTVMRVRTQAQDSSLPVIVDHVINQQTEPVTARLTYVTTLSEPVKTWHDGKGRPVTPEKAARPASTFEGALIMEFDGATRPATLLAFHQEGAVAEPKVSWPGPTLLKLEYDVVLPPRKSATFRHGAAQRPLASFGSVMEAFTGCLPFQRPPDPNNSIEYMNVK